jgi:hypothetical protein
VSRMNALLVWSAVVVLAGAPAAQDLPAFANETIAGGKGAAVAVAWLHGGGVAPGHDLGVAAVLAQVRLARAAAVAPRVQASVHVDGAVACIVGVTAAAQAASLAPFAAALLDDGAAMGDDAIAAAIARAALQADDQEFLVPAGVLARRVGRHFGGAEPGSGSAAMLALAPADVRERLRVPVPTLARARGAIPAEVAAALAALPLSVGELPRPALRAAATATAAAGSAPPALHTEVHSRVDQPFVVAAFAAPPAPHAAAFAVACEVARARAIRRFPLRGSEPRAGTWFVAWAWLAGDDCVRFHRRGCDPVKLLPGERASDVAAECEATAAELRAFLADLRERPPTAEEVGRAQATVLAETGLSMAARQSADPAVLGGRLRASLLASVRGIDAEAVGAVTPATAAAALAATLAEAGACWWALLPAAIPGIGWRPR